MKIKKILSVFPVLAMPVLYVPAGIYAENTSGMVYSDFNSNDVNGTINVNIPENTTAEIMITFTSPEVSDTPYYIINANGKKTVSMDVEGRDTTENDYRNYTLRVELSSTEYDDIVVYTDTFSVPDVNDNPDSFLKCDYNFSVDNKYSGSDWTLTSENETEKNITMHYGNSEMGDVNNDGFINAVDASIVSIEYTLLSTENGKGTFNERQKLSADVNKDGFINAVDSSMISIYYTELSTNGNPTWEIPTENTTTTTTNTTTTTATTSATETTHTTTTTVTTVPETYSPYEKTVQLMAENVTDSMLHHEYYIHDINNDGIYELIIETGETEEDDKYSVYSMKNGEVIFAGDINAEYSYLSVNGETLYNVYGQAQTASVAKISFDGEKVFSENTARDTDYGTAIPAYDLKNMSGINRIMNDEQYTYFDTTNADDDFIFNENYSAEKGTVNTSSGDLNLREKPTTASGIITTMPDSAELNIYGHNDGWAYISYENGGKTYYGFASMTYIESASFTTTTTTNTTTTTDTTTTTTTATVVNNFSINNYPLYEKRLQEIRTAMENNDFDYSFSPKYKYNSEKGYILMDLNSDNIPELIITADYEYSDIQDILEVYSIYENQLVKICQSEEQLSYHLCDNNVISYSGRSGMNELSTLYYQYKSGNSLDTIGTLIYRNETTGIIWSYNNSQITEDEAKEIQEKYKLIKVQSNSL